MDECSEPKVKSLAKSLKILSCFTIQEPVLGVTELAERIGVSTSFVGHVERGTRKASLETLVALSNALGVGVDYLLAGSLHNGPDEKDPSTTMDPNRRMVIREILTTLQEHLSDWGPDK
mgnify:CR=1 FL=1